MKQILMVAAILHSFLSYGQFRLSGVISNYRETGNLTVNVPLVYGRFVEENRQLVPGEEGRFEIILPVYEEKIGYLHWGNRDIFLWMKPGEELEIESDSLGGPIRFNGTSAAVNALLMELELHKSPAFYSEKKRVEPGQMADSVVNPGRRKLAEKIARVDASSLSESEKAFLRAELHYHFVVYADLYARTAGWPRETWSAFALDLMKTETTTPRSVLKGPMYDAFINTYLEFLETRAFSNRDDPDKFADELNSVYGVNNLDTLTGLHERYGGAYINWLVVKRMFPGASAERYLAGQVKAKYSGGELSEGNYLLNELVIFNSNSAYIDTLTILKKTLISKMNGKHDDIVIPEDYRTFADIKTIIERYRGKVVYLDVWGTWCGPCKIEMRYLPDLKRRVEGKDIVFLYLDMDEDSKDGRWREYIRVNGVTGIHLRKNNADIQAIWAELLPHNKGLHGRYPSYFIFDKNGRLIDEEAKRPGDGENLVKQLEKYL